jgi:transposase-like protein
MGSTNVTVCPECDSATIENRVADGKKGRTSDGDYYCLDCHAHFDNPDNRPAKGGTVGGSELAAKLAAADPEVKYE